MNIRKFATITVLVLSSFAATNVAPTKAELEAMYDKAFREFNANNYPEALKQLDAIDARQPDLAESHNLRGVILMRQAQYDQAEVSLQKALATDPKFWNARFNLAEIPFLRKDWAEGRKRFDALLQGDAAELQGEAAQLIQYKILLTYLLQGNDNMVDSILAKFELSPDTPAANYSRVAIALQHKNQKEATDLMATAEKSFSPQLNKLFAESLYEVGWLQKPVGQSRAALELTSGANRAAKSKAVATEKYEQAEQAFQQYDLTAARRLVEEADAADPNQAATLNLRGEILLAQGDFDGAEGAFKRAIKIDPKLAEAHYNLAQIPFKKKDYAKARERFEALFAGTPSSGGDKNQTAQIIKFKIFLTLLLEGKDSRAQKMMEQFKFTGDTPALYYAQAAWEFKHNNTAKANLWIVSSRKIYSPALNLVFADSFYDLGWLQRQSPATAATSTEVAKNDAPAIEPSPIPATSLAADKTEKQQPPADVASVKSPETTTKSADTAVGSAETEPKVEPTVATAQTVATKEEKPAVVPASSPKVEQPAVVSTPAVASNTVAPAVEKKVATAPTAAPVVALQSNNLAAARKPAQNVVTKGAPAPSTTTLSKAARDPLKPSVIERLDKMTSSNALFEGVLLLAGGSLIAWVVIAEIRRRVHGPAYQSQVQAPPAGPRLGTTERPAPGANVVAPVRISGGPPQVSLHLKASEPSVRRAAVPFSKVSRPMGASGPISPASPTGNGIAAERFAPRATTPVHEHEPIIDPLAESVGENAVTSERQFGHELSSGSASEVTSLASAQEWEFKPSKGQPIPNDGEVLSTPEISPLAPELSLVTDEPTMFAPPSVIEPATSFLTPPIEMPALDQTTTEPAAIEESRFEAPVVEEPIEARTIEGTIETPAMEEPTLETPSVVEEVEFEAPVVEEPAVEPPAAKEPTLETLSVVEEVEFEAPVVEEPAVEPPATEEQPEPMMGAFETEPAVEALVPEILQEELPEPPAVEELATEPEVAEPVAESQEIEEIQVPEMVVPVEDRGVAGLEFSESVGESIPIPSEMFVEQASASIQESFKPEAEPVAQGQPIPYQIPAFLDEPIEDEMPKTESELLPSDLPEEDIDSGEFRPMVEPSPFVPQIITTEPLAQQPTVPAIMQTIQPTPVPIRTAPVTGATPQPSSMQTAVQLTFSFEIASLQLTPSFKMGTLQLKPTSKIVTMRLAPSQQPQPAMNLQVTFEVSSVQLAGNSIGIIRLVPSQQQRPGVINTPAFNIAGLQLLSGADSAVQLTPSQQGQASVHVTGRFQIATVEFSPSFEISSIILNSTSKNVSVQLPGAGPSAVEGAPVFEITNVQLGSNGEIGMMHLNAQGLPPKPA